jgi:flagellar basal body-associated protein FliL
MAAEEAKPPQTEQKDAPAKKGLPVKTIGIVAVVMVLEAVLIVALLGMTGPKAAKAEAKDLHGQEEAKQEALAEIQLVEDNFQNMQTGRVWMWNVSVFIQVREKNKEHVAKQAEQRQAEIKEGIAQIFRRAQHSHLKEPGLETINRQLATYLNRVFGNDAEGAPRVERVMIPRCRGMPAD